MNGLVDEAFRAVPRRNFLPEEVQANAGLDIPLPIGFGQTNSQPSTVAMMLEWLDVEPGQNILDVGSGSGWTTGLLAYLTGKHGHVTAIEKVPELLKFGRDNCLRTGIKNAEFHLAGEEYGWQGNAPYDRILVSAAAVKVPRELLDQLSNDGRMVIPVRNSVLVIDKDEEGQVNQREYPGFMFVPLV